MTFRVYPDPPTDPLALAAGATSAPVPIVEELFGSSDTMFIRYVLVGTDCAPPPSSPAPTVFLVTDGIEHEIISADFGQPTPVAAGKAFASVVSEGRSVFRLEVTKIEPVRITWQIRFRNNHPAGAHQLTWVVADTVAETGQPWIEVPHEAVWPTLPSGTQPGQAVPLQVQVANKGTGDLVISDVPRPLENSDFTLLTVPPRILPNACRNLEFEFTPPASSGRSTVSYTVTSNDSTALPGSPEASHNKRLDLVAEVGIPAPAFNASPPQFNPDKGVPGTRVTLNGRNFDAGTPEVVFGAVAAALVGAPTSAGVTTLVPAGLPPGGVQITVSTDGGTAVSDEVFTVLGLPPQLEGFTPPRGRSEDPETSTPGTVVTITGNHFDENVDVETTVTFGDKPAVVDDITNTRIRTKVPTVSSGNHFITVATEWGEDRSADPFTVVPKPAFNASPRQFSPAEGAPGITVTLNGRNFGPGTPGVRFGTVAAASVGVPTPAGVTAVVPAGLPLGGVQITVTADGGTAVSDDVFTVEGPPPQLDGFTPPRGRSEDPETSTPGTTVTITGKHFEVGGTTVTFGDKPAVVNGITNTRILTKVPAIPVGNYPITVATQWGQARSTVPFVVQAISTSGELARRTRIRAFRRESSNVLIVARGENPTSGYRVDIEQSPKDVSPPQFNLLRFPPGDIKPPPVEPYRYEEVVSFPSDKPRITINHAEGSDVVNIGRTYVVRRNDTMGEIASDFRISLEALTAANPQIPNINRIDVGQMINIPPTYVVQRGDTMGEIAVRFEVSLEALAAENPQIRNINVIRPRQVIIIP